MKQRPEIYPLPLVQLSDEECKKVAERDPRYKAIPGGKHFPH
jgi:hypothetical protein